MSAPSDIVFGSFIADALSLGPHWVYDSRQIEEKLGRVTAYHPPLTSYHPGKVAGDLTHYGDQALVLLRSITNRGGFELDSFAREWRGFWEEPENGSYRDGATKSTLAHLQGGAAADAAASSSNDMGGTARIAPLFLLPWESDEALFAAARKVTGFTHGDPSVIESAEFFTRVTLAVQRGAEIPAALEDAMAADCGSALPREWLAAGQASSAGPLNDTEALDHHGLSCHVPDAFPGICHLLLRHPRDPAAALIENASAGGDCAARGMILGMVYAAKFPVSTWPAEWSRDLNARPEITRLLEKLA
jgi:ADP-ribosylglycohydrolase